MLTEAELNVCPVTLTGCETQSVKHLIARTYRTRSKSKRYLVEWPHTRWNSPGFAGCRLPLMLFDELQARRTKRELTRWNPLH